MKSAEAPIQPTSSALPPGSGVFRFAGFTLDTSRGLLSRGPTTLELRPKSFALLSFLVRNSGRVLSKDELLDAVWNDVTVTEDSLTQCIHDIRVTLGESGQALIRTLPRRGYMFDTVDAPQPVPATMPPASDAGEGRPRVAVLAFRNLGGEAAQDHLSAGITEDIITALARFSSLTVTGQHAVSRLATITTEPEKAASLLGVNFVVDGSVRFADDRIRITARLLAVQSGTTLWADHFDRQREAIFAIQDEVVTSIAAALDERLVVAGAGQARQKPASNWSSYDCLLQGRALCNQHREVDALPFLKDAVERDPASALAHGWYAIAQACAFAITTEPFYRQGAVASAGHALRCDEHNDVAQWSKALALQWNGQIGAAEPHFRRAMQLNPANIQVRGDHANWLRYMGRNEEALQEIDTALAQDPFAPHWFHAVRAGVLLDRRDYAGALEAIGRMPYLNAHILQHQIAACAWLGDKAVTAAAVAELQLYWPAANLRAAATIMPYADESLTAHLVEGLRKAGIPEF